jgi:hypothetical protein
MVFFIYVTYQGEGVMEPATEVAGCRGRTTEPRKSPECEMLAATVENFGQYNLSGTSLAYCRDVMVQQQAAKAKERNAE